MKQEVHPDKHFYPNLLDHEFLVIMFQKINVLYWIYTKN